MDIEETEVRNDCADEDQKQFNELTVQSPCLGLKCVCILSNIRVLGCLGKAQGGICKRNIATSVTADLLYRQNIYQRTRNIKIR
jgi:hypothetical protein